MLSPPGMLDSGKEQIQVVFSNFLKVVKSSVQFKDKWKI